VFDHDRVLRWCGQAVEPPSDEVGRGIPIDSTTARPVAKLADVGDAATPHFCRLSTWKDETNRLGLSVVHSAQSTVPSQQSKKTERGRLTASVDYLVGYDLFISYARRDGSEYAEDLKRQLDAAGVSCFLDRDDVEAGVELRPSLARALTRSAALVVIVTTSARSSAYVALESDTFATKGRPIISVLSIPVTIRPSAAASHSPGRQPASDTRKPCRRKHDCAMASVPPVLFPSRSSFPPVLFPSRSSLPPVLFSSRPLFLPSSSSPVLLSSLI
jgi:hypothetical protein